MSIICNDMRILKRLTGQANGALKEPVFLCKPLCAVNCLINIDAAGCQSGSKRAS